MAELVDAEDLKSPSRKGVQVRVLPSAPFEHGSHRSRRDLHRILAGATLDELAIVRRTAGEMNLADLLDDVLAEQDEIDA